MINQELFYSLELMLNSASEFQRLGADLQDCNELEAIKASWACESAPVGLVSWIYYTVQDHDYVFAPQIKDRAIDTFMYKLGGVIKTGGYTKLDKSVMKLDKKATQLAEDVAEATGGK